MMTDPSDVEALNQLVADPDLERLNDLLGEFNLFEALGVVRQELRHSNFLAWLLNPSENHGLGDYTLRKFMLLVTREAQDKTLSPAHVSLWDLEQAIILREWRNIDILIVHPNKTYAVVIENKIGTGEHSNQLARYQTIMESEYPQAVKLFILLSPDGIPPEDEESNYTPLGYGRIHQMIAEILKAKHNTLSNDVQVFIQHYQSMLGRSIMTDSDIAQLCRAIYEKNRRALDLILEHRPDLQSQLKDYIQQILGSSHPNIYPGYGHKRWINIGVNTWVLGEHQIFLAFQNTENRLKMFIYLYPSDREIYLNLVQIASQHGLPVKTTAKRRASTIHTYNLLNSTDYEDITLEELQEKIQQHWQHFLERDFPKWDAVIQQAIRDYKGDTT